MTRSAVRSAAVAAGIAVLVTWVFFIPFSLLGSANLGLVNALVAISLVILTGWVGQISLAQAAFVGIAAFTTGLLVRDWGVPFPLTLPLGAGASAVAAALLGLVALRVRGLFLAVGTLIFAWMTQEYLFNQPWFAGVGGSSSALVEPLGTEGSIPYLDFTERRTFYFVLLATVAATLIGAANLRDSKTGRSWFAVKGSEIAAASLGINVTRSKLLAFAVSGFIAGMAGVLVMTHEQVVTSTAFSVQVSLFYLSIAVVGGLTSLGGAIGAAALFAGLEEVFFRVEALSGLTPIISSALLVLVLTFFPAGLAGLGATVRRARAPGWLMDVARIARERVAHRMTAAPGAGPESLDDAVGGDESTSDEVSVAHTWTGRTSLERLRRLVRPGRPVTPRTRTVRDSLGETLAASNEAAVEAKAVEDTAERARLAYTPNTATKVKLPARRRRTPVLSAENVTVRFGGLTAVDSFDLEVREHEIVGLMGPNGAGKTTLFNAISGLNDPASGSVVLLGEPVTDLGVHDRAIRGMGRTFQAIQLFRDLTVFENLVVATHQLNPTGFLAHVTASGSAVLHEYEMRDRVRHVVDLIGLDDVVDRRVADLPFGVLRLVELGRALVTGAHFLMLDEPASGLDNTETDKFMDLLLWARQTLGVTMLLIEHDVRMVTGLADYMYVIDRGRKIAEGTPEAVQRDPEVIAAYLGRSESDGEAGARAPRTRRSRSSARSRGGASPREASGRARAVSRA